MHPLRSLQTRVQVVRLLRCLVCLAQLTLVFTGCQPRQFMLTVSGDEKTEGADVFVNGKWVGTLQKSGDQPPRFSSTFPYGTLTIEVKKPGYLPFLEVVTVTSKVGEHGVRAVLAAETKTDEPVDDTGSKAPRRSSQDKLPVCPD